MSWLPASAAAKHAPWLPYCFSNVFSSICPPAGELVACKRGSPMILGIKEGISSERRTSFNRLMDALEPRFRSTALECWVASDASAILEHTKK